MLWHHVAGWLALKVSGSFCELWEFEGIFFWLAIQYACGVEI